MNSDGYFQAGNGLLDTNMNAYCGNNPVNRVDKDGYFWGYIVIAVIDVVVSVVANTIKNSVIDNHKGVNAAEKELARKDPIGAIKGNEAHNIANEYQKELYPKVL